MFFGNGFITGERRGQTTLALRFTEKGKDLVSALAKHFLAAPPGNPLHCTVPRNDSPVAIERKEAVDAGVEQALQERWGFVLQSVKSVDFVQEFILPR